MLAPLASVLFLHRKCKLVTSGPWLEVAPIALGDVSIIPESPDTEECGHSIALWAVSDKGDVLCRLGVSELNPAVSTSSWCPVPPRPARFLPKSGVLVSEASLLGVPGPAQDESLGLEATTPGLSGSLCPQGSRC
jgi:hypothetical protein